MKLQLEELQGSGRARPAKSGPELQQAIAAASTGDRQNSSAGSKRRRRRRPDLREWARRTTPGASSTFTCCPHLGSGSHPAEARTGARARLTRLRGAAQSRAAAASAGRRPPSEYQARAEAAITKYMAFLKDQDLLTIEPYLDPAMRAHIGDFVPEPQRNFFQIASHIEPMTLFAHFYHWFDHAWMEHLPNAEPRPPRRAALATSGTRARRAWPRPWRS